MFGCTGPCCFVWAFFSCGSWGLPCCSAWTSHCSGFSSFGAQALGLLGSVAVVQGLGCHTACGIFLEPEWNPCPQHWQVDSQPLDHHRSPALDFISHLLSSHQLLMSETEPSSKVFVCLLRSFYLKNKLAVYVYCQFFSCPFVQGLPLWLS